MLTACTGQAQQPATEEPADVVAADTLVETVAPEPEVELVADSVSTAVARFYAGVSMDGVKVGADLANQWRNYSSELKSSVDHSYATLHLVDSMARVDMSDIRQKADYVFYPFSGPDFLYPITLFPDADTYFLMGLEGAGSPLTSIDRSRFNAYRKALRVYLRSSYFITKEMKQDLRNDDIDGTLPIITMLMAIDDCQIISTRFKALTDEGEMVDSPKASALVEVRFFRTGSHHEQTLYYYSTNLHDSSFESRLKLYLDKTLSQHQVVSYLKAASYLMHEKHFNTIREYILRYSFAFLQDDSGMPYHYVNQGWDITLYGKYIHPKDCFDKNDYQPDLDSLYARDPNVHQLPIFIGYNKPSNWMLSRKKQ